MLELDKRMIPKAMEKHKSNYPPKYRFFHILKKNIEDVVTKSTSSRKSIYGLSTPAITKKSEKEMQELEQNRKQRG